MSDLLYSDDAINVRNAFFDVKTIIYVEGDDDVLFWEEIFNQVTDDGFVVEPVGGAVALDEYIRKIDSGTLQVIAARDSDHHRIIGSCSNNPRVLYTYGYSIENSFYTTTTLAEIVKPWCKSTQITIEECKDWLHQLVNSLQGLVHLDAANAIASSGVVTLGDNCSRYMSSDKLASEKSIVICPTKVGDAINRITPNISPIAVASANSSIGFEPENLLTHLRGHFLASAAHRYIVKRAKDFEKKVSISAESLYSSAIMQFSNSLKNNHPHKEYYLQKARIAWDAS